MVSQKKILSKEKFWFRKKFEFENHFGYEKIVGSEINLGFKTNLGLFNLYWYPIIYLKSQFQPILYLVVLMLVLLVVSESDFIATSAQLSWDWAELGKNTKHQQMTRFSDINFCKFRAFDAAK